MTPLGPFGELVVGVMPYFAGVCTAWFLIAWTIARRARVKAYGPGGGRK